MHPLHTLLNNQPVQWLSVEELFDIKNGYTPSKSNAAYWENGSIPWFRMEDIRANGRILNHALQSVHPNAVKGGRLFPANSIMLSTTATIGEHALITVPYLSNQQLSNFTIKPKFQPLLDVKFAFYYFFLISEKCKNILNNSSMPSVQMGELRNFRFPLPPLPLQARIVEILDNFTACNEQLTAALNKEHTLRKKQYAHHRDLLLSEAELSKVGFEWKTLGEVGEVTKLAGFEFTNYVQYSEQGNIIALRGLNVKGTLDLSDVKYIDNSDFTKLSRSKLIVDDMLFTYVGTVGNVALIPENDKYYLAPNVARIRFLDKTQILPRFMLFYFQTSFFQSQQIGQYLNSSSMKNLTMENIRKFKIPLPPLAHQQKIVEILDRFDTLTNSITQGIPREIELRRKQYEYYRELLLTFE